MVMLLLMGLAFIALGAAMLAFGALVGGTGDPLGDLLGLGLTGAIFVVVGLVLFAVGSYVRRSEQRKERIRRTGVAGQATITDIRETNITVNHRPMLRLSLRVAVPGRPPYAVEHRMVLPWSALGRLGVGVTVPVKVDRAKPDELVIDWAGPAATTWPATMALPGATATPSPAVSVPSAPAPDSLTAMAPNMISVTGGPAASAAPVAPDGGEALLAYLRGMGIEITGPLAQQIVAAMGQAEAFAPGQAVAAPGQAVSIVGQSTVPGGSTMPSPAASAVPPGPPASVDLLPDAAQLRSSGLRGRAMVRSSQDLGVETQGQRLVRMDLEVTPEGRTPYPLQHVTVVPATSLARVVPGVSLAVHVDPANQHNVAVDWDGA